MQEIIAKKIEKEHLRLHILLFICCGTCFVVRELEDIFSAVTPLWEN